MVKGFMKKIMPVLAALSLYVSAEKVSVNPNNPIDTNNIVVKAKKVPVSLELDEKCTVKPSEGLEKHFFELMRSKGLDVKFYPEYDSNGGKTEVTLRAEYNLNGKEGTFFMPGGNYDVICEKDTFNVTVSVSEAVQIIYSVKESPNSTSYTSFVVAGGLETELVKVFPFGFDVYKKKLPLPGVSEESLSASGGVAPVKYTFKKTKGEKDVLGDPFYKITFNPGLPEEYSSTFYQK